MAHEVSINHSERASETEAIDQPSFSNSVIISLLIPGNISVVIVHFMVKKEA